MPLYQRVGNVAYKAGLETTEALDRALGHPHRRFKSIHIAGTNGKGSVAHLIAAIVQQAGYRTGLYTSPHLKDFRERIKINGVCIPEGEVVAFVNRHRALLDDLRPSFFEMTTAMAFDWFVRGGADVAVVETGMGGRLDATNVIAPLVSIITNIGLDHTEHLGATQELIAREKAGIIKPHTPVVIGERGPATDPVFEEVARRQGAPLIFADTRLTATREAGGTGATFALAYAGATDAPVRVTLDLPGDYQQANIVTALAAIDRLRRGTPPPLTIAPEAIAGALPQAARMTGLQGRWQILSAAPLTICDTGHNAHGLQYAFRQLATIPYRRLHIVFGVVADKDLSAILPLMPRAADYYFTQADLPRALDAQTLADRCRAAGLVGDVVPRVAEAFAQARRRAGADDVIYIGGSTFVVAEVL
jgi:dihydrofolate synthase/folylpolyglutamate synthase